MKEKYLRMLKEIKCRNQIIQVPPKSKCKSIDRRQQIRAIRIKRAILIKRGIKTESTAVSYSNQQ